MHPLRELIGGLLVGLDIIEAIWVAGLLGILDEVAPVLGDPLGELAQLLHAEMVVIDSHRMAFFHIVFRPE